MNRRDFLKRVPLGTVLVASAISAQLRPQLFGAVRAGAAMSLDAAQAKDWLARWEKNILNSARSRYCDKEMGEELGWLVSPILNGFYYGYLATHDSKWVERLIEWTDACIKRAVKEPDDFLGWPKGDGGGGDSKEYSADSLLGEAMMLRPVVLMADEILKTAALKEKWRAKAQDYLELAGQVFQKWDSRDCWREVKNGGLWVVPAFGTDLQSGKWSAGYARRKTEGFSNPANKQNHIARWLIAMHDVTKKSVYRERAEQWWRLMKSRMRTREDGKFLVWNYWDPAGPWDYKSDGSPRHWVGIHPNGGYYQIDVEGIVAAFEHGLVFKQEDIDRLIATNRDFMWNKQIIGAKFQRIDGEQPDPRWKNSPGMLWTALVPYDAKLREIFVTNHNPDGWGGTSGTPWFLSLNHE
jgi:hypothetical protein